MITVEFDQAKMRRYLLRFFAVFLTGAGLAAVITVLLLPDGPMSGAMTSWHGWLAVAAGGFVMGQFAVFFEYAMALKRGLKQKTPAVVISHTGITDNASQFAFGQLAWDQIEKMYPYDVKTHLITNWWTKMPVVFKQRGVAIQLKDDANLSNVWYRSGKRRWLFIPEMTLPVTANDLMSQINKFYVAEVREY